MSGLSKPSIPQTPKPCDSCNNSGWKGISYCPDCLIGSKLKAANTHTITADEIKEIASHKAPLVDQQLSNVTPCTPKFRIPLGDYKPIDKPKPIVKPMTIQLMPSITADPISIVPKLTMEEATILRNTVMARPEMVKLTKAVEKTLETHPFIAEIKARTKIELVVPKIPIAKQVGLVIDGLVDQHGNPITLDRDQARAVELTQTGKSCVILGKAGTGKTTSVQAVALSWIAHDDWHATSYRQQGTGARYEAPSIAIVAATNRAANNMAARLISHHKLGIEGVGFGFNITTIHNLLEYTVEFLTDPETGNKKPHYFPLRDSLNKLDITHLVLEEATLVGVGEASLWNELLAALPKGCQILMLGDINQLPPVIGKSVLNYAIQQLPRVELTKPHRTALDNPIIRQALNCIDGKPIVEDFDPVKCQGVRIFHGKATWKLAPDEFLHSFKRLIDNMIKAGQYDPMVDMVLSPYNKHSLDQRGSAKVVSSTGLAKSIATTLAAKQDNPVYEIRAGFVLKYFRVGDRVFVDKKEGIISSINHNVSYYGKGVKPASHALDYFGGYSNPSKQGDKEATEEDEWDNYSGLSIEEMIDQEDVGEEERKRAASHTIEVTFPNDLADSSNDFIASYQAVGDVANIELGYALSVHKSQGSEWPVVIMALHQSNATNLFRELVYTAMTRPQIRLDIVGQKEIVDKAAINQRIKGSTLEAKIEFFNSGYLDQEVQLEP